MFVFVVCFFVFLFALLFIQWKTKLRNFPSVPLGPYIPIAGSVFHFETDSMLFLKQINELSRQSGFLYVVWLFFKPMLVISQVEFAEIVLKSPEVITKSVLYTFLHPWLGTGLLTSTHGKWKNRRRVLTPTFHFTILNDFTRIFVKQAQILVKKLEKVVDTDKMVDVQVPVSLATLDIICETAMGVSINAQSDSESEYVNAINVANKELQVRQKYPWNWPDFIYKHTSRGKRFFKTIETLHAFTTNVINEKIAKRKEKDAESKFSGGKTKAFMDLLLDLYEKGDIDVEGIREEVDTFMFEGHDTTAAGLSWTLYLLGQHPDIQKQLHQEVDECARNQEYDLIDKIKNLKFIECVLKEGLRLHPPVALFGRELEKDTELGGDVYPKGTSLILDVISLHTNPDHWDDPLSFKPSRFTEEKFLKRNPYCYVPFSAGPRNCIGQKFALLEEKILLYHIMLHFEVRTVQDEDSIKPCAEIIHKSDNGLGVTFHSREK